MIERPWFVGIPDPWIPENVVIYFDDGDTTTAVSDTAKENDV